MIDFIATIGTGAIVVTIFMGVIVAIWKAFTG